MGSKKQRSKDTLDVQNDIHTLPRTERQELFEKEVLPLINHVRERAKELGFLHFMFFQVEEVALEDVESKVFTGSVSAYMHSVDCASPLIEAADAINDAMQITQDSRIFPSYATKQAIDLAQMRLPVMVVMRGSGGGELRERKLHD